MKREVFFITKPLSPPWNDSAKNLPYNQINYARKFRYEVLTASGATIDLPGVKSSEFYSSATSVSTSEKVKLLARIFLLGGRFSILHFFFTPTFKTVSAVRFALKIAGGSSKIVQTLTSMPHDLSAFSLFGDGIIVLSDFSLEKVTRTLRGKTGKKIRRIYPGVIPLTPPDRGRRKELIGKYNIPNKKLVMFAGDLEFSETAWDVFNAIPKVIEQDDAFFLFACREKTPAAREIASRLRAAAARKRLDANFAIHSDMPDIREILHLVDVLIMPLRTLYAKMDIPLIMIEALEAGVPVVIDSTPSPLLEIFKREVGVIVRRNKGESLSEGITSLLIDRNFAIRCSENARIVYKELFTAERMAAEVEEFYGSL